MRKLKELSFVLLFFRSPKEKSESPRCTVKHAATYSRRCHNFFGIFMPEIAENIKNANGGSSLVFSSIAFLYYFLAATLAAYFIAPSKAKNLVLLLFSLVFYFWGEQLYTLIMVFDIVIAYVFGLLIDKFRRSPHAKVFLAASVALCLLLLGFFKYSDFFVDSVNGLFDASLSSLGLALPIGISFFTFQAISYDIDVYRGTAAVQKSIISLATYISFFPQLIAGPIVRYTDVERELNTRTHTLENFSNGAFRFAVGLMKKVVIADNLYAFTQLFSASQNKSVAFYWAYAAAFSLYVYFDFSGYSDMAIGLGRIFGFRFGENFDYPFISQSISEFWRRWHISLGSWFRDYVYIPLGGNRVSKARWMFNIMTVWFLTGLWHGASWNFVIWGLYFGVFIALERTALKKIITKAPRALRHIYLVAAVAVSFVIFNADGIGGAIIDLKNMFGFGGLPLWSGETAYYLSSFAVVFAIAAVGSTPLVKRAAVKICTAKATKDIGAVIKPIVMAAFIIVVTAYFADGSFSPFLYFRF